MGCRAAWIPTFAATQKPLWRGKRIARTIWNSVATALATPCGDASSTTMTSVLFGARRGTLARQARSRSPRLWQGMTIDNSGGNTLLLAANNIGEAAAGD